MRGFWSKLDKGSEGIHQTPQLQGSREFEGDFRIWAKIPKSKWVRISSGKDAQMQVELPYIMILVHNQPAKCMKMQEIKD